MDDKKSRYDSTSVEVRLDGKLVCVWMPFHKGDVFALADVERAVAKLEEHNVPPCDDGTYEFWAPVNASSLLSGAMLDTFEHVLLALGGLVRRAPDAILGPMRADAWALALEQAGYREPNVTKDLELLERGLRAFAAAGIIHAAPRDATGADRWSLRAPPPEDEEVDWSLFDGGFTREKLLAQPQMTTPEELEKVLSDRSDSRSVVVFSEEEICARAAFLQKVIGEVRDRRCPRGVELQFDVVRPADCEPGFLVRARFALDGWRFQDEALVEASEVRLPKASPLEPDSDLLGEIVAEAHARELLGENLATLIEPMFDRAAADLMHHVATKGVKR